MSQLLTIGGEDGDMQDPIANINPRVLEMHMFYMKTGVNAQRKHATP